MRESRAEVFRNLQGSVTSVTYKTFQKLKPLDRRAKNLASPARAAVPMAAVESRAHAGALPSVPEEGDHVPEPSDTAIAAAAAFSQGSGSSRLSTSTPRTCADGCASGGLSGAYNALMRPLLLDPRTSKRIWRWDLCTVLALGFTTFVTPFEVALLSGLSSVVLFWVNRIVDCIFVTDLFVQFLLIFKRSGAAAEMAQWEVTPTRIAAHYLRGWFALDTISVLASLLDIGGDAGWFGGIDIKIIDALRLVRLIKLVRLVKLARMLRRWESRVSIPYQVISLTKSTIGICVFAHWMACSWVICTSARLSGNRLPC